MAEPPSDDSGTPRGPLDELAPGMRQRAEDVPRAPVHPRVLRVPDDAGEVAITLVCWADPGGPRALHRELRNRLEAALLAELSQPASALREHGEHPASCVRLALFEEVPHTAEAVRAFGMQHVDPRAGGWRDVLAHIRHEAEHAGHTIPHRPASAWEAPVSRAHPRLDLDAVERALLDESGDERWGEQPGAPFRRLVRALHRHGGPQVAPTLDGLRELEPWLVHPTESAIRWMPPAVFQSLCDGLALVAALDRGWPVEWGLCEPGDDGLAPPPVVRIAQADGHFHHLPLGLGVLRWCIMPLQPDEHVPPVADWLRDQLGET